MKRLTKWLGFGLVIVVATLVALSFFNPLKLIPESESDDGATSVERETAEVAVRDLEEEFEAAGNLVFVESFGVTGSTAGTVSELSSPNTLLAPGDVLYVRDDQPVVFLVGSVPAWRALSNGDEGSDVLQLEQNLVDLGYGDESEITVDETFTSATVTIVQRWQEDLGVAETGSIGRDDVVFGPENARLGSVSGTVGGSAAGPSLMTIATDERQLEFELSADQRIRLNVGDEITARLPDRSRVTATVVDFSPLGDGVWQAQASIEGDAELPVGDVVPITVAWTDVVAAQAKTVPASAVLRLDSGDYVVEVVNGEDVEAVTVTPGQRFGTFVEIVGDVEVGDQVIAP